MRQALIFKRVQYGIRKQEFWNGLNVKVYIINPTHKVPQNVWLTESIVSNTASEDTGITLCSQQYPSLILHSVTVISMLSSFPEINWLNVCEKGVFF